MAGEELAGASRGGFRDVLRSFSHGGRGGAKGLGSVQLGAAELSAGGGQHDAGTGRPPGDHGVRRGHGAGREAELCGHSASRRIDLISAKYPRLPDKRSLVTEGGFVLNSLSELCG